MGYWDYSPAYKVPLTLQALDLPPYGVGLIEDYIGVPQRDTAV